jgi:ATP-dependent RNA helicase DBP3
MFSATWPPEVAKLAAEFLRDPLKITIGSEDLTANHDVHQIVEVCEPTGREPKLEQLLRKYHADRK